MMSATWRAQQPYYSFETDLVAGQYLTAGQYQGMRSLIHRPTAVEIAAGEKLPGLVAPYRVFGNGRRYGDLRDRPTEVQSVAEGLRITHSADQDNPFDFVALHTWAGDALDVRYTIHAHEDFRAFEVGIASYLSAGFRAFAYRQSHIWGEKDDKFVPVDSNPMTDVYAIFPRGEAEMKTIFDGRWDLPPYPVRYGAPAFFAHPLAYRRQAKSGVMAVGMGDPRECYAVAIPVNDPPDDPDPTKGYQAIYFYHFGRDLKQGETAKFRVRWIVGQNISDQEILQRWDSFASEQ
jgi:hypothetical protein